MSRFFASVPVEASAEEVFAWHAHPGAFERLNPPWDPVEVAERSGGIESGARVRLLPHLGPLRFPWTIEHRDTVPGRQFRDVQVRGPFAHWQHTHRFVPRGPHASQLEDEIDYQLPGGALGRRLAGAGIERRLRALFAWRHAVIARDVPLHIRAGAPMTLLITGASGLIGSALGPFLTSGGHAVRRLTRRPNAAHPDEFGWNPAAGELDPAALEGLDAVVHLAGESLAGSGPATLRWTPERKRRILESRIQGTTLLCESLARQPRPPHTLICASAMGVYGDRGDELLGEASAPGQGFLAEVCQAWEAACAPAREAGIRVVHLRLGIVLTPAGGALRAMLPAFRWGVAGRLGEGAQWMSWVSIEDVIGAVHHALYHPELSGPVNVAAPAPVRNREFTRTLAAVLRRPALLPLPAAALRLAMGEAADEMLLASMRLDPARLRQTHYAFRHPELRGALSWLLGRS